MFYLIKRIFNIFLCQRQSYSLKFQVIFFIILITPFLSNASIIYDCHYNPDWLQYEERARWDLIRIKGLGVIEEEGKPMIPIDYIQLLIPHGNKAESLRVTINSLINIEGSYRIKVFFPDDDNLIDTTFETLSSPYPGKRAEIAHTGSFGGNRIVSIKVYPIDYYQKTGRLVLFSDFKIELFYRPSRMISKKQLNRTKYSNYIIQNTLKNLVENDDDIPLYSINSFIKDEILKKELNFVYYPYIIITVDSLVDAFCPLTYWLTKKGIKATTISIDSILKIHSFDPISNIYDDAGALRSFLLDAYKNGTYWILLGGDEEIIPVRYGTSENNDSTIQERPPSDLYYSDLDGDWNVDGDELYGEPIDDSVDICPELFVGRLPCNNRREISNWIEKLLIYEKNPGNGDYEYLKKVFWSAADQMRYQPDYLIENDFFPSSVRHDTTILENSDGSFPKGSEVVEKMSENFGWFNMYLHGAPDQLTVSAPGYNEGGSKRDFLVSVDSCDEFHNNRHPGSSRIESCNGLDSLKNMEYYGIMFLNSCYPGAYDFEYFELFDNYCGPSIAEAYTLLPECGGPSLLGYTRYGRVISSMVFHMRFLNNLFNDTLPNNIGVLEALSKTQVFPHFIHLSHTLFGCPLMPVWTAEPQNFRVVYRILRLRKRTFIVALITSRGKPVKDAYICLWKEDEIYKTKFSNHNGLIWMFLEPKTEGEMYLTVTKKNFIPYEDVVYITNNTSFTKDETIFYPDCKIIKSVFGREILFELNLHAESMVKLDIFDITGRRVNRLIYRRLVRGIHQISWRCEDSKGNNLPNGVYFYLLQNENYNQRGKFIILK